VQMAGALGALLALRKAKARARCVVCARCVISCPVRIRSLRTPCAAFRRLRNSTAASIA
jgi:hypothetical protein